MRFLVNMISKPTMMSTIEDIKAYAAKCFAGARGSHDWGHTERVANLCLRIGRAEGADLVVLEIAACLHDVGRPYEDTSKGMICHAEKGAEIAGHLLAAYPVPPDRRENIIHCIRTHRFRGNHRPETLEAKVLFDADKLDSIGAIGIGRTFLFAGEVGATLHNPHVEPQDTKPYTMEDTGYREYMLKLAKIKGGMLTQEGGRIAEDRHAFMEEFFERFLEEYGGLK
jgi:uncharacterized protein